MNNLLKIVCLLLLETSASAVQFNVAEMPEGAEITVPQAATTVVPVKSRILVTSTDQPQTIRISPSVVTSKPLSLTIEGAGQSVKTVTLHSGAPFLYSFKGLSTVTLSSDDPTVIKGHRASTLLTIESDKPLTVKVVKF